MDGEISGWKRPAPVEGVAIPSKRQQRKAGWKAIGKARQAAKKQTYQVGNDIECQRRSGRWDVPGRPLTKDRLENAIKQYEQDRQIVERGQGHYAIDNPHYVLRGSLLYPSMPLSG
jgi:hypothetical protein